MPLHPAYTEKLRLLNSQNAPPLRAVPVELIRETYRTMQPERPDVAVESVQEVTIPTDSGTLGIRIYRPSLRDDLPVVLMFHGGGWVIGDLTTVDGQCRDVAVGTGAIVVAVDYRLAPEHRFPTAAEDCFSALNWVHDNIHAYGGDSARLGVAGDSAGGNLAAVVALMSRDRHGPELQCQLLVYPVIDGTNFDSSSYLENAQGFGLTRDDMLWFWDQYTNCDDRTNPYASPIVAESMSDLPPALILTAEYDVLRDEGEAYGERLRTDGVDAEVVRFDGFIHGFFAETKSVPATRKAMRLACQRLSKYLRPE
ncbi:MAG: alpha/beta hydrolase [Gammaproteobacteria bacterium]|nr:alpha/beta hydrolase [Gammaproteobacteria bacterium]